MSSLKARLLLFFSIIIAITTLAVSLSFYNNEITVVKDLTDTIHEEIYLTDPTTGEGSISKYDYHFNDNICGIRITDICDDLNIINKINYYPDKFLKAGSAMRDGQIVDLNNDTIKFSKRGTLQLIILGPDPFSPTFNEDIKKLEKFRRGDYWYITLQLPNIFSASNVYVGNKCVATHGKIKDYEFIQNSVTDNSKTNYHESSIDNTIIELEYYTSRIAMNPNLIPTDQIVTIHYEINTDTISPINNSPFIGMYHKVVNYDLTNVRLQLILTVISGIVISIFLFIIFLKKKKIYMPLLLSSLGIFIYSISYILLNSGTNMPLTILTFYRISPAITMFTVLISIMLGFHSKKTRKLMIAIIVLFTLSLTIPVIMPFVGGEASGALRIVMRVLLTILACISIIVMLYGLIIKNKRIEAYIIPLLIALSIIIYAIDRDYSMIYIDPVYWVLLITEIATFTIFLKLFSNIEKQNVYLTSNLKTEIDIRTNELTKALDERNTILQFVTHDLKKPTAYYINSLHKLETQIKDENQLKLIKSLLDKSKEINQSLTTISEFAKLNFLKEKLSVININDYLSSIYESTKPDCDASGVYLTLDKSIQDISVFAKRDGLKSALLNIIFNSLEHSECSEIKISAQKVKGTVEITVSDNGKGINKDIDIFKPYVSEIKGGSHGLGLYISKQAIESMNGSISYTSSSLGTTFKIILQLYAE